MKRVIVAGQSALSSKTPVGPVTLLPTLRSEILFECQRLPEGHQRVGSTNVSEFRANRWPNCGHSASQASFPKKRVTSQYAESSVINGSFDQTVLETLPLMRRRLIADVPRRARRRINTPADQRLQRTRPCRQRYVINGSHFGTFRQTVLVHENRAASARRQGYPFVSIGLVGLSSDSSGRPCVSNVISRCKGLAE